MGTGGLPEGLSATGTKRGSKRHGSKMEKWAKTKMDCGSERAGPPQGVPLFSSCSCTNVWLPHEGHQGAA